MTHDGTQPDHEGDPELEDRIYGLLMDFSARTSQLSTLKRAADQAQSRLHRAHEDLESSQSVRFKQFSAIREQKRESKNRAQILVEETAEAVRQEISVQEKSAKTLAILIARNSTLKDRQRERDARLDAMSRDLDALRHDVQQMRGGSEAEWRDLKAKIESCNERISASFTTLSQRIHECESKMQGFKNAIESGQLDSNNTSQAINRLSGDYKRLEIQCINVDKKYEELVETCGRIDRESVEKDKIVVETYDEMKASLVTTSENLSRRLDQLEAANSQNPLQRDLDGVIATVSRLEDNLRAVQAQHEKISITSNGQAAAYSVSSFTPATQAAPQENGHPLTNGSHGDPINPIPDELRQLKAGLQSLKHRFDNLTTDHVVRQMLDQLHYVYADARNWQEAVNRFTREIGGLQNDFAIQRREHVELDKALGDARGATDDLRNMIQKTGIAAHNVDQALTMRLEALQNDTRTTQDQFSLSLSQLEDRTKMLNDQLRELAKPR